MESLTFVPSRVVGLPDVSRVVVKPDRLELLSGGKWVTVKFAAIAKWPRPKWLWKGLALLGKRSSWLPVGNRDWFHPPPDRFFIFYTNPKLVIYMPFDEPEERDASNFFLIQQVLHKGGFQNYDLG
jgi:hypothetical protein